MSRAFGSNIRRRQLDAQLSDPSLRTLMRPHRGWIREIRESLGMSAAQLAGRIGIRQPTVAKMQRTEIEDTISLKSLRKAADAMDCDLVYAFVPRKSLESILETQAMRRTSEMMKRVEHTMILEAQSRSADVEQRELGELAQDMVRTMNRTLWEV